MTSPLAAPMSWRTLGPAQAPWLVLCHGMGLDAANMQGLAEALANRRRVLLWDMPGHGGTPAAKDCSARAMAAHGLRVMDQAGVDRADFVGFSFGGVVAQIVAAQAPARVRSLVAYGCFAPFHQSPPLGPVQRVALLAAWRLLPWPSLRRQFAKACAATPHGQADVSRALEGTSKATLHAMSAALFDCFEPGAQVRFPMPLMLLRGALDTNAAALDSAWEGLMLHHSPRATHVIPAAGHCAHNDAPDATASAIAAFLDDIATSAEAGGRLP